LPEPEKRLLRQIAAQVEHRFQSMKTGRSVAAQSWSGISALFAGESGTGKTLAAEVLAKVLDWIVSHRSFQRSQQVIGETEKNLRRLFDTAEDSGVVLFFDEADAFSASARSEGQPRSVTRILKSIICYNGSKPQRTGYPGY